MENLNDLLKRAKEISKKMELKTVCSCGRMIEFEEIETEIDGKKDKIRVPKPCKHLEKQDKDERQKISLQMKLDYYRNLFGLSYMGGIYEEIDVRELETENYTHILAQTEMKRILEAVCGGAKKVKGLLLYGDEGVGKTWYACALRQEFIKKGIPALGISFPLLLDELRGNIGDAKGNYSKILSVINKAPVLILDELSIRKQEKEYGQERLYNILETRLRDGLPTICTTNIWTDATKQIKDCISNDLLEQKYKECEKNMIHDAYISLGDRFGNRTAGRLVRGMSLVYLKGKNSLSRALSGKE